jgi:hypothetical protein
MISIFLLKRDMNIMQAGMAAVNTGDRYGSRLSGVQAGQHNEKQPGTAWH